MHAYLQKFPFHAEFHEPWPIQGEMRVHIGLADELPPPLLTSSILAIVTDGGGGVLCVHPDEYANNICQFLIGGRQEGNETPREALVREVLEETGWSVDPLGVIGYRHFHQLDPQSALSDRPYPDFIQPIFAARAVCQDLSQAIPLDLVPSRMIGLQEALAKLPAEQHPLILAAAGKIIG